MQGTVRCTNCQKTFRLPESLLGKPVKCPECGTIFTAPNTSDPAPSPEPAPAPPRTATTWGPPPEHAPPPPPRPALSEELPEAEDVGEVAGRPAQLLPSPGGEGWGGIGLAAGLQAIANGLYAGALLLLMLLFVLALDSGGGSRGGRSVTEALLIVLVWFLALALVANWVLGVVAGAFWVLAPPRAHARPLAIALLVLGALVLLQSSELLRALPASEDRGPFAHSLTFVLVALLLDYARLIVLGFTIHALGLNLKRDGLGMAARLLTFVTPAVLAALFLLNLLFVLLDRPGKWVGILVLFLNLAGLVAVLVFGGLLLARLWLLTRPPSAGPLPRPVEDAFEAAPLPRGRDPRLR